MGGTVLIIWHFSLLWLGKNERGRGSQIGGEMEGPICSPLPLPHSRLQGAGEPLLQSGDSHCPPEEEGLGAPRW